MVLKLTLNQVKRLTSASFVGRGAHTTQTINNTRTQDHTTVTALPGETFYTPQTERDPMTMKSTQKSYPPAHKYFVSTIDNSTAYEITKEPQK